MRKFTLLFISIISIILLTSCLNFEFGGGTKTPEPTVETTPTPVNIYTVTFMNGGKVHKTYSVLEGDKVSKPVVPTKEGYTFVCWSTSETVKNEFDFTSEITGSITIYAYFEEIEAETPEE